MISAKCSARSAFRQRCNGLRYRLPGAAVLLSVMITAGCASTGGGAAVRQALPPSGDSAQVSLTASNLEFGVDLYRALVAEPGVDNLFVSPHSISTALAMTYAGARGETERQMAQALHFELPQPTLHATFAALDQTLTGQESSHEGDLFRLVIANALWGNRDTDFLDTFVTNAETYYAAEVTSLDFIGDPEASRGRINDWVAEKTEQMIPELLVEGTIHDRTRLVLTNAVYFKAMWSVTFDEHATVDDAFERLDGVDVQVPMMHGEMMISHAETRDCEIVEIPYAGNRISFVAFMPDSGDFEDFEAELSAELLGELLAETRSALADITMPSFETRSAAALAQILVELGMPIAFGEDADFTGMRTEPGLMLQDVIHQAVIELDESGTEAAAATAVLVVEESEQIGPDPISVRLDRPFIYLIRDAETGAVLFMGRLLDPSE